MKKITLYILLFFLSIIVNAQQEALFTHYMFNKLLYNPATAGTENNIELMSIHRSQWVAFKGAPVTQNLIGQLPINNKMGLGLTVLNDKAGPLRYTNFSGDYSYSIQISEKSKLAFGVKASLNLLSANINQLVAIDQSDVTLNENINNNTSSNIGAGLYYYSNNMFVGVSSPRIIQNRISTTNNLGTSTSILEEVRHYYIVAGKTFILTDTESLVYKPTTLIKATENGPVQIDITSTFEYNNKISGGIAWRINEGLGLLFGLNITQNLGFGYAYDWSYGNQTFKYNGGSHEAFIRYRINKKVKSPKTIIDDIVVEEQKTQSDSAIKKILTAINGLVEYNKLPAENIELALFDENDHINAIQKVISDKNGNFKFAQLDVHHNYILRIEEEKENDSEKYQVFFTNTKGEKILKANFLGKGKYTFKTLPYDKYQELPLMEEKDESLFTVNVFAKIYDKLGNTIDNGLEVLLIDDDGLIILKNFTDANGSISFSKLLPDDEYLFIIPEKDENLIFVAFDNNGNIIDTLQRLDNGRYVYRRLKSQQETLDLFNENGMKIKVGTNENFVISKILYDYKSSEINPDAAKELNKLLVILKNNSDIIIELTSHTDSKGNPAYNKKLSEERAKKTKDYLVSIGVNPSRIKEKGLGSSNPIAPNSNPDGSDNPEGRAKNRRTEFKIIKLK